MEKAVTTRFVVPVFATVTSVTAVSMPTTVLLNAIEPGLMVNDGVVATASRAQNAITQNINAGARERSRDANFMAKTATYSMRPGENGIAQMGDPPSGGIV
jgi:hypothetical protein